MGRAPRRVLAAVVLAGSLAGCTSSVAGLPLADPAAAGDDGSGTQLPSLGPTPGAPAGGGPPVVDAGLPDDCLLAPEQLAALAGFPAATSEQTRVTQSDGQVVESCFYFETGGFSPRARVQVSAPAPGATVAQVLDQVVGTPLPGVGDRAVLVRSAGQEVLWAAAGQRIATVRLSDGLSATDTAFTTAGQQALAALATR